MSGGTAMPLSNRKKLQKCALPYPPLPSLSRLLIDLDLTQIHQGRMLLLTMTKPDRIICAGHGE